MTQNSQVSGPGERNLRCYHLITSYPSAGSVCPSPKLPITGNTCTPSETLDRGCSYENLIHVLGGDASCCCGQCDVDLTCNSTSGEGVWAPTHSPLCPALGCGLEGQPVYLHISKSFFKSWQVMSPHQSTRRNTLTTFEKQRQ